MIDAIFDFTNLIITCSLTIWIFLIWRKYPYASLKYLLTTMFFFLIDIITSILYLISPNNLEGNTVRNLSSIIFIMWAFYFLVLFFETFYHTSPFSNLTSIMGISALITTISGIITTIVIFLVKELLFAGIKTLYDPVLVTSLDTIGLGILYIYLGVNLLGGLTIWSLMFYNIFQISRRIWKDKYINLKPGVKTILYWLISGNILLLIGSIFTVGEFLIGEIFVIVGYSILYIRYLSGGIFILQSNSLRRLIILDGDGSPVYSYHFMIKQLENVSKTKSDIEDVSMDSSHSEGVKTDEDILFSGALQGVSMLLGEVMGTDQKLKEIVFEDVNLIIYNLAETQTSFILVSEQITRFYNEALKNFAETLPSSVDLTQKGVMFGKEESEIANNLISQYFGI